MPRISDEQLADYENHITQRRRLGNEVTSYRTSEMVDLIADLREAREQLTKAETVLQFYGDNKQWKPVTTGTGDDLSYTVPMYWEKGETARAYFTAKDAAPKGDRS